MAVSAYYLTGTCTYTQVRESMGRYGMRDTIQVWDAWPIQIVFGHTAEEAQRLFEDALRAQPEGENPRQVVIRKIAAAPMVDKLLTESGNVPFDWPKILEQADALLQSTAMDDFEQGYWVGVDEVVKPDKLSFSVGTLQSDVPEDIRSGLNWSGDKKFFFLVIVLPPPPPPRPDPVARLGELVEEAETPENEDSVEAGSGKLDEFGVIFS